MDEPVRILVVDDSATIRTALQLILEPTGHAIEFAVSGADAIAQLTERPPAMVLLDFILPDMRGTEVCRALLADERTRRVPVVLVSARGAEIRQAYQDVDNVVAYLTKPFTPDQVHEVIEDVLAMIADGLEFGAAAATPPAPDAAPAPVEPAAEPAAGPAPAGAGADDAPTLEIAPVTDGAPAPGGDDDLDEALDAGPAPEPPRAAPREALEAMFETLRASLEGVHVEEVDTPAAAAADRSRSYAELAADVARQLGETLAHATSGARYALCSDGSIRSLGDALLDAHRRVCRLVFRSLDAGVAATRPADGGARVLVVGRADGAAAEAVDAAARGADWHLFRITSGFCQLPLMARLYGPTHLVVDLSGPTLWAELAALRQMSESRRLRVIGVIAAGAAIPEEARLARHGVGALLVAGPHLADDLRDGIAGDAAPPSAPAADTPPLQASAA